MRSRLGLGSRGGWGTERSPQATLSDELSEAADRELRLGTTGQSVHTHARLSRSHFFFCASVPPVFYQACQLCKGRTAPAEPNSPVNQADFGTYRVDCFSPRSTLICLHTVVPIQPCICCPCHGGDSCSLYVRFASPYVQKFLPRGEVQVSAGEVCVSTALPD